MQTTLMEKALVGVMKFRVGAIDDEELDIQGGITPK
jgi:hypothetical protein